jgi:hypothetical protein
VRLYLADSSNNTIVAAGAFLQGRGLPFRLLISF